MNNITSLAEQRGKMIVRDLAVRFGYGPITVAACIRSFRPDPGLPVAPQAINHVRGPDMSATSLIVA